MLRACAARSRSPPSSSSRSCSRPRSGTRCDRRPQTRQRDRATRRLRFPRARFGTRRFSSARATRSIIGSSRAARSMSMATWSRVRSFVRNTSSFNAPNAPRPMRPAPLRSRPTSFLLKAMSSGGTAEASAACRSPQMHQQIARTVPALGFGAEGQLGEVFPAIPDARHPPAAQTPLGAVAPRAPVPAVPVWHWGSSGCRPQCVELARLFVNGHLGAPPPKQAGERQAADAGADNGDVGLPAHAPFSSRCGPASVTPAGRAPPPATRPRSYRRVPRSSGPPC